MKIRLVKNLPSALTLILSGFVISIRAAFYWTLYDFDVINDTNETCHGFEIELEGMHKEDITYTFGAPMSRYGDPPLEDKFDIYGNVVGCYLCYRAEFDEENKQFIQKTLAVRSAQQKGEGHYACDFKDSVGDNYDKSCCERFGLGFLFGFTNPSKTTSWNMISQLSNFETSKPYSVGATSPYSMETVMAWVQQLFETYHNNNFSDPIYLQDAKAYSGQPNYTMRQLMPNKYVVSLPLTVDQCAIKLEFPCDEDGKAIHNRDDIIEAIDCFEMIGR
jgi:hypothetical protein